MARILVGLDKGEAQEKVLQSLAAGMKVEAAMAEVARQYKTYEDWMREPEFNAQVKAIRLQNKLAHMEARDPALMNLDFITWRERYLGLETPWHARQWVDMLEGNAPRDLHPAEEYHPGNPKRILINTPPYHAKSTIITQQYVAYRICLNKNVKILIVSKTQKQAKKFLYSVKRMLTEPAFAKLQLAYAPEGGFKPKRGGNEVWSSTQIIVAGRSDDAIDPEAKDSTVEAVGIGGHIQGSRADLIIIDDPEDDTNVAQWEKHLDWINEQVQSRLYGGRILVVMTRVASVDLATELRNGNNFPTGVSAWTYLIQPVVLRFAEDPADWETLWPKSSRPLDVEAEDNVADAEGMFETWTGPRLAAVRDGITSRSWSLLYMQNPEAGNKVFPEVSVWGCVDRRRAPGPMRPGELGGRRDGMAGLHVILAIDPADTGEAFAMVYGVDRTRNAELGGNERWVMQCWHRDGASSTAWYADLIEAVVPVYGVTEIVIESNKGTWLLQDERIVNYCRNHGIVIGPHYTSRNKVDPNMGVESLGPLFGTATRSDVGGRYVHQDNNLIHIPDPKRSYAVQLLCEQLISWVPGKRGKDLRQDGPMCLWFAELRARPVLSNLGTTLHHMPNKFLSKRARESRMVLQLQSSEGAHGYQYA